jgi:hypothetical protein
LTEWDTQESEQQGRIDFYAKETQLTTEREKNYVGKTTAVQTYFTDLLTYTQTKQHEERQKLYAIKEQRKIWEKNLESLLTGFSAMSPFRPQL